MDKVSRTGGVASPEVLKVLEWFKSQLGQSDKVMEEWHEGVEFYRVYASGFIEQVGYVTPHYNWTDVTFRKAFTNIPYVNVSHNLKSDASFGSLGGYNPKNITTTGFRFWSLQDSVIHGSFFYACGY